jgi:hypothetical protein
MSVMVAVSLIIFGLLDLISIVSEIFGRRAVSTNGTKVLRFAHRRRVWLHLGVYALIIGGFWAIVHFGPLRPVHEWLR